MAPHVQVAIDDSDTTSTSNDSDKYILDTSTSVPLCPTASEIHYATVPIAERNEPSCCKSKEEKLDPRYPRVIPERRPSHGRTLILCFDGTGDQFDADNSNIVRLVSVLKKNDRLKQMVYYQAGIGTYHADGKLTGFISSIRKTLDQMVASSIDAHIISGYKFLMQNYIEGDSICLFGFSRGAYTARGLAGMLFKVGLLPPGNLQQLPFAFRMYNRADTCGWDESREFKSAFSIDVTIKFIGVWDTVSSLGAFRGRSLPVATASTNAEIFRQALSLDERRARFQPHLWKEKRKDNVNYCESINHIKTDVEEVWFAGCHCDVGGGSVSNKTRHSLASISLRWMIRECFKTNTGILFNSQSLADIGLDLSTLHPKVISRPSAFPVGRNDFIQDMPPPARSIPINIREFSEKQKKQPPGRYLADMGCLEAMGSEEEEDLHDVLSPIYDQLSLVKLWWFCEILPYIHIHHDQEGKFERKFYKPHFGKPRHIPHETPKVIKVHRSVLSRKEANYENEKKKGKKYNPEPLHHSGVYPIYVD